MCRLEAFDDFLDVLYAMPLAAYPTDLGRLVAALQIEQPVPFRPFTVEFDQVHALELSDNVRQPQGGNDRCAGVTDL